MANKHTARSPSNIAFIKYWGAKDLARAIPFNPSLSMTLERCYSRTTAEWLDEEGEDEIRWRAAGVTHSDLETAPPAFAERVRRHLDTLRAWSGRGGRFRVATENSFPAAAGMASSASGFSALTLAVLGALEIEASSAEQSMLARLSGSGSAARSVIGGYVEWPKSPSSSPFSKGGGPEESPSSSPFSKGGGPEKSPSSSGVTCYATQVAGADHWDLRDVVAVVERGAKKTSSLDGHRRVETSPYWPTRQQQLPGRLAAVRQAIAERDFLALGEVIEAEMVDLHCVAMTSEPPIFYWRPATLAVLAAVREMRRGGVAAYSTMDAGANVHVICEPESEAEVAARLGRLDVELSLIHDGVGPGPVAEDEHLF